MSKYFTINIEKGAIGSFAEEVRLLLDAYGKNTNIGISSNQALIKYQALLTGPSNNLNKYGIRHKLFNENEKLTSTAIQLAGKIIQEHMPSTFGHLIPEFYIYDEICDCAFSFIDEKINTRINQAKLLVNNVLTGSKNSYSIVSDLLSEKNGYKLNNLILIWLGNVSEDSWIPIQERDRVRAFLSIYTHCFFEKYEHILLGYKMLIHNEKEKICKVLNEEEICFVTLLTGCEHLAEYVDIDAQGIMLTRRMLEQFPSNIIKNKQGIIVHEFDDVDHEEIIKECISKQLKKEVKHFKEIIFLDIASKSKTIQKYLLPIFDQRSIKVRYIILRYIVTKYDEYNSFGFGGKADSEVTKVANILDDGFPSETTSPIGINTITRKPTGFYLTNRKWFHSKVKHQILVARDKRVSLKTLLKLLKKKSVMFVPTIAIYLMNNLIKKTITIRRN